MGKKPSNQCQPVVQDAQETGAFRIFSLKGSTPGEPVCGAARCYNCCSAGYLGQSYEPLGLGRQITSSSLRKSLKYVEIIGQLSHS